jgi:hypothetical protein
MDGGGYIQDIPGFLDTGCFFANSPNLRYFGMDGADPAIYDYDGNLVHTFTTIDSVSYVDGGSVLGVLSRVGTYTQAMPVPLSHGVIWVRRSSYNDYWDGGGSGYTVSDIQYHTGNFTYHIAGYTCNDRQYISEANDDGVISNILTAKSLIRFIRLGNYSKTDIIYPANFVFDFNKYKYYFGVFRAGTYNPSTYTVSEVKTIKVISSDGVVAQSEIMAQSENNFDVNTRYGTTNKNDAGGRITTESNTNTIIYYYTPWGGDKGTGTIIGIFPSNFTIWQGEAQQFRGMSSNFLILDSTNYETGDKYAIRNMTEVINLSGLFTFAGNSFFFFDGDFLYWNYDNKIYRINLTTLVIELIVECVP